MIFLPSILLSPNDFLRHTDIKLTQVQVTYGASKNYPIVKILILFPEDTEDYTFVLAKNEYQSAILPDGWRQHTYIFETDYCPSFENIKILPPDNRELFIDSVVIDTVCREKNSSCYEIVITQPINIHSFASDILAME